MKKAIVTGSTGFIGSAFVNFLISSGIDVIALGRKPLTQVKENRREKIKNAKYINLDMGEIDKLYREIEKIKWDVGTECVFFNLAWGGKKALSDLDIEAQMKNVSWSVEALEESVKIGCSRFIQVGTMEEAFTHKYLKLDHHNNNQYNRHVIYSVAKIAAKKALQLRASSLNIDYIYVLHSHVMGEDDDKDSFLQVTLQKLINGEDLIFSSGEQIFDVISLEDCARGYYLICEKGKPGEEYWVGSGEPKKLREYVEKMYNIFPSKKEMQFGKLPYNDIVLSKDDFSIEKLVRHTGYKSAITYEEIVKSLHKSLLNKIRGNNS
jgi:nucleoside-diphosphate-sugar epimerase